MRVSKVNVLCLSTCVVCVSSSDVIEEKSSGYMASGLMNESEVFFSFSLFYWTRAERSPWTETIEGYRRAHSVVLTKIAIQISNHKAAISPRMIVASRKYKVCQGYITLEVKKSQLTGSPSSACESLGVLIESYYQVIQTCLRRVLFVHQGQHACVYLNRRILFSPHIETIASPMTPWALLSLFSSSKGYCSVFSFIESSPFSNKADEHDNNALRRTS